MRMCVRYAVVCVTPASTRKGRAEHCCGQDRVFPWPTRAVPSAIHSATSSTALAPSALADAPPVASSNWRTTSAASRPRSLTFRPCARAHFRAASLCASEPLLLAPPPEPARLGARRRLAGHSSLHRCGRGFLAQARERPAAAGPSESMPAACRATPAVVLGARRTDQARAPRRLHRVGHDPWLERSCYEHRRRPQAVQPPGPASHISTVPLQQQRSATTGRTLPSRRRCCL